MGTVGVIIGGNEQYGERTVCLYPLAVLRSLAGAAEMSVARGWEYLEYGFIGQRQHRVGRFTPFCPVYFVERARMLHLARFLLLLLMVLLMTG